MKYNLLFDGNKVVENIIAKDEKQAWKLVHKMGIKNKSNSYSLEELK